ncbi:MAG: AraC family transcriptional regulator [Candidatus Cryptobacteroides sp.]
MSDVLYEISPLSSKDCFHIAERHKSYFNYPLHRHRECELNFVQHGKGARRVIGDSVEEIGEYDLVLITGQDLEHVWEQGNCKSPDIREITIQFSPDFLGSELMSKNQFDSITKMIEKARHGIAFPIDAIMKVYSILDTITEQKDGFLQLLDMLKMLYELSQFQPKILASTSFAHATKDNESRRVRLVKDYISEHYAEELSLEQLSSLIGMSPSSFSRFFKQRTNKTLTDYISDIRLGVAARALVDSTQNISEICYACGFNNMSNFNRVFKNKRGMTPKEFRALYKKNQVFV